MSDASLFFLMSASAWIDLCIDMKGKGAMNQNCCSQAILKAMVRALTLVRVSVYFCQNINLKMLKIIYP